MNYEKLDTALATALNNVHDSEEKSLTVFIHTESIADPAATAVLESLGVSGVTNGQDVFSATLSPNAISQLSEQPWVQYLTLSQKLRLIKRRDIGSLGV
jgi:type V secretory pathway adhesin AidA